jgi:DNA-binding transcriptional MerR regulator
MLVGELARRAGVSIHTVRYYEKAGLFKSQKRKDNNYREYPDDCVSLILFIKKVQKLGFDLREIKEVVDIFRKANYTGDIILEKTNIKLREVDNKISELKEVRALLLKIIEMCEKDRHLPKDLNHLFEKVKILPIK